MLLAIKWFGAVTCATALPTVANCLREVVSINVCLGAHRRVILPAKPDNRSGVLHRNIMLICRGIIYGVDIGEVKVAQGSPQNVWQGRLGTSALTNAVKRQNLIST